MCIALWHDIVWMLHWVGGFSGLVYVVGFLFNQGRAFLVQYDELA